jgi:membrane-associated phospholipid phosphatase
MKIIKIFKEDRHTWVVPVYLIFYVVVFAILEQSTSDVHIIHCSLDDKIPFCEYFIIPYVMWYIFMAGSIIYFAFYCGSRTEYWQFICTAGTGLTLFLIFSFLYPNGLAIRPVLGDGNIFMQAVKLLYRIDTPTNVLPSMHVYISLVCAVALCKNQKFAESRVRVAAVQLLAGLICISTMMLKQHSVVDVLLGILLYAACYQLFYRILPQYGEQTGRAKTRVAYNRMH